GPGPGPLPVQVQAAARPRRACRGLPGDGVRRRAGSRRRTGGVREVQEHAQGQPGHARPLHPADRHGPARQGAGCRRSQLRASGPRAHRGHRAPGARGARGGPEARTRDRLGGRGGGARDHGPEPHRSGVRRGGGGGRAERDVSLGRLRGGEVKVFARWGRFVYRVVSIRSPYNVAPQGATSLTSRDGHEALVLVEISSTGQQAWKDYAALRDQVKSPTLSVTGTGFVPINQAFNTTLESDLQRAEYVSLPITLLLLIVIFAGVMAAGLPLGVGILTIVGGLGGMFFLNRFTDVSQYAANIVTLIGLGVSIDYSLFVVNRFRDELAKGASREDAIADRK